MFTPTLSRGALAGAAGAAALVAFAPLEARMFGREPIYSARRVARALFGPRGPRFAGLLRLGYAMGLGLLIGAFSPRQPWAVRTLMAGSAIARFERLALPCLGATPPLSRWPRAERTGLLLHALVFAGAASGIQRRPARRAASFVLNGT
jgi:hypothetical protein